VIKGYIWKWKCGEPNCSQHAKLFADKDLTNEYCEPQMKSHCNQIWSCLHNKPILIEKVKGIHMEDPPVLLVQDWSE
jgi:hypothetical protein